MNKSYEYLGARVAELERALKDGKQEALAPDPMAWEGGVKYKERAYYQTGKWGTRISDGLMGCEYRTSGDARIWVYRDGSISED